MKRLVLILTVMAVLVPTSLWAQDNKADILGDFLFCLYVTRWIERLRRAGKRLYPVTLLRCFPSWETSVGNIRTAVVPWNTCLVPVPPTEQTKHQSLDTLFSAVRTSATAAGITSRWPTVAAWM